MSEEKLTTWTDEQLQEQLDLWASQIEQGELNTMPEKILLRGSYPYNTRALIIEQVIYTLSFGEQTIKLTSEQARHIDEWMNTYRFQFQLNSLDAVCKEISSQNQQQENKA